ncbi:MAG: S41 family peptidase [Bacteroidaceae bacterium]|nr:S41 family peptidase [Bacteroidaceae bacterium]
MQSEYITKSPYTYLYRLVALIRASIAPITNLHKVYTPLSIRRGVGGEAVLLLFLLTSCVNEEQLPDTPKGNLDALWTIIDEHYCFLDYKEQSLAIDWDEIYTRYLARLTTNMGNAQLFEVLTEMLGELQDGHVNLYASHDIGRYWSWYEDYPLNFDQEIQDAYLGKDYKIASSLKYRILPDNIGYIVCSSFESNLGNGNLDEVMGALRLCNGLIIDVRNNTGGALTNAERLAQRFTNERRLVGYMCHKTGPGHNDFSSPDPQYLEPSTGIRWQKQAVVLTNRKCYSATNTFVRDVRECPLVTIMGDQTGGGSGMPFSSELPNGWSVRFSACPMFDARMQQIEFGIQPDTVVTLSPTDQTRGIDTMIEAARQWLKLKYCP